jgi:xanthine dehydrogenase accessory factor
MDKELYRHIRDCLMRQQRLVLATVVVRSGSSPREAGASMAVKEGGESMGTVGGGLLEAQVIAAAQEVLHSSRPLCLTFSLSAKEIAAGGMLCGGRVEVLVDVLDGMDNGVLPLFEKICAAQAEGRGVWLLRSICPEQPERVVINPAFNNILDSHMRGSDIINMDSGRSNTTGTVAPEAALTVVRTSVRTGLGLMDEDNVNAGSLEMTDLTMEILKKERRCDEATLVASGGLRYLLQPVVGPGRVIVAGAGHVAQELATLCHFLGIRTVIIDDRREFAGRDRFPAADEIVIAREAFQDSFLGMEIDRDCCIVIVTRGHEHDRNVLAQALRTGAGYLGMIGSRRKRDTIYGSLREEGFSEEDLARVHCPIGIAIGARTPAEIAVSIAAELISFRAGKS